MLNGKVPVLSKLLLGELAAEENGLDCRLPKIVRMIKEPGTQSFELDPWYLRSFKSNNGRHT